MDPGSWPNHGAAKVKNKSIRGIALWQPFAKRTGTILLHQAPPCLSLELRWNEFSPHSNFLQTRSGAPKPNKVKERNCAIVLHSMSRLVRQDGLLLQIISKICFVNYSTEKYSVYFLDKIFYWGAFITQRSIQCITFVEIPWARAEIWRSDFDKLSMFTHWLEHSK